MPRSLAELRREAVDLGLLFSTVQGQQRKPANESPRAKLLQYCYNSYKAHRSFNHVSMMLLGTTGAGKSSTVNHLLGVDVAAVSHTSSQTRSTTEFVVTANDPSIGVNNLTMV